MGSTEMDGEQVEKLTLEVEHLRRQNEKLAIEIQTLKATSPTSLWEGRLSRFIPVITALVAVGGLWFGVVQFKRAERAALDQRESAERAAVAQRTQADRTQQLELAREKAQPLWDMQLGLYVDAAETAATIATTTDDTLRKQAEARFWVLYWGPLAVVEDVAPSKPASAAVEEAMVHFGDLLFGNRDPKKMKTKSLALAHAIRDALDPTFGVKGADLKGRRGRSMSKRQKK